MLWYNSLVKLLLIISLDSYPHFPLWLHISQWNYYNSCYCDSIKHVELRWGWLTIDRKSRQYRGQRRNDDSIDDYLHISNIPISKTLKAYLIHRILVLLLFVEISSYYLIHFFFILFFFFCYLQFSTWELWVSIRAITDCSLSLLSN